MKKTAMALLLILIIMGSLVTGSIAAYTVGVDLAFGTIVAKEFASSGIHVLYETTKPWGSPSEFKYQITITNNTEERISDWYITFMLLEDRIIIPEENIPEDQIPWNAKPWNARNAHEGLPEGEYKFINPQYNNEETDNILVGKRVSFGGMALGNGVEPIKNILVNGKAVELECIFGELQ